MQYAKYKTRPVFLSASTWLSVAVMVVVTFASNIVMARPPAPVPPQTESEAESSLQAAWEYRPYKVVVWIAHNNSWRLQSIEENLAQRLSERARLADRSGWRLTIERAPNPWNWRLISDSFDRDLYSGDLQADVLNAGSTQDADKLIVVQIEEDLGLFKTTVTEFELHTRVWGASVIRTSERGNLDQVVFNSIRTAFMPLTRIENVLDSDARCRVRAIGICNYAERDDNGEWQLIPNTGSPVWIDDNEILMPVVLRSDRRGNLESIKTIHWTFLTIADRAGPSLNCKINAMRRHPLGGRTGGRTERLGLCVRAPDRQTTLKLISNDKEQIALPDLEVYSRRPDQDSDSDSEFIGKTDWRGQIVIPPNEDPVRILYIKSGRRPLARVPMVPGLYDQQMTSMPNDENRLYAEGITRGLFNELMDNVARRQLMAERIRIALERSQLDRADDLLKELRDIPSAESYKRRLNQEKQVLLKDADKREKDIINRYFLQLDNAASNFLNTLEQAKLSKQVQDAKKK